METYKSPGTDGLPAEFYKALRILQISTVELFTYNKGQLSITQREASPN